MSVRMSVVREVLEGAKQGRGLRTSQDDAALAEVERWEHAVEALGGVLLMVRHDPDWDEISGWLTRGQIEAIDDALTALKETQP